MIDIEERLRRTGEHIRAAASQTTITTGSVRIDVSDWRRVGPTVIVFGQDVEVRTLDGDHLGITWTTRNGLPVTLVVEGVAIDDFQPLIDRLLAVTEREWDEIAAAPDLPVGTLGPGPSTSVSPDLEWTGRMEIDLESGLVTAPQFNEFVTQAHPTWAQDARASARQLIEPVNNRPARNHSTPRSRRPSGRRRDHLKPDGRLDVGGPLPTHA